MSEYRPTEYVVNFGDCRSNRFVGLNMTLIKQNGAKLHERIVRCRDCIGLVETWDGWECERFSGEYHRAEPDGFCAWGERMGD